jgi:hypothetical protein
MTEIVWAESILVGSHGDEEQDQITKPTAPVHRHHAGRALKLVIEAPGHGGQTLGL